MRLEGNSPNGRCCFSTANDQADQKSGTEGAQDALGGILADVVFGRDVQFLGFHSGVLPLFGGGFLEMKGFLRGGRLELAGPLGGGVAELLGGFHGAVFKRGGFFLGGVDEFAGFFASGGAEIIGGL